MIKINIDEALENPNIDNFEEADKKANNKEKFKFRKTIQVSVYFDKKEINAINDICIQTSTSRASFVKKAVVDKLKKMKKIN